MPLSPAERLEQIKELAIIGMFSDDDMMEVLVLKGGNALDLIYKFSSRSSVDVDFSMADDLPGGADEFRQRAERALTQTYDENGYTAFDFKLVETPKKISDDIKDFWGGYGLTFKLLTKEHAQRVTDLDARRREAINLGQGTSFEIEISRFEFVEQKVAHTLQGFVVFAYSPEMILAEKLRALCQQTPEYAKVVHRSRPGAPRAKDFIDIYVLATERKIDITTKENRQLLALIFEAKKVPLELLHEIEHARSFHAANFDQVRDAIKPGFKLETFDFYFDFVIDLIRQLQTSRDK